MLVPFHPEYHDRAPENDSYYRLVQAMHTASEIFDLADVLEDYAKYLEPDTGEYDSHMQLYLGSNATQQTVVLSNQEVAQNRGLVGLQKVTFHDDYVHDRFSLIVGTGRNTCIVVMRDDEGITVDCQLNGTGNVYRRPDLHLVPEVTLQSIENTMNALFTVFQNDLDPLAQRIGKTLLANTRPYYNYFFHPSAFDKN